MGELAPWLLPSQDRLVSKAAPLPEDKALSWGILSSSYRAPCLQELPVLSLGMPWCGSGQSSAQGVSPLTPTCPSLSDSPCAMALAVPRQTPAYTALTAGVHTERRTLRLEQQAREEESRVLTRGPRCPGGPSSPLSPGSPCKEGGGESTAGAGSGREPLNTSSGLEAGKLLGRRCY